LEIKGQNMRSLTIKLNFSFANDGQNNYLVIETESDYPNIKIRANGKQSPNVSLRSNDSSMDSFFSFSDPLAQQNTESAKSQSEVNLQLNDSNKDQQKLKTEEFTSHVF